jgi:hypothetical protein
MELLQLVESAHHDKRTRKKRTRRFGLVVFLRSVHRTAGECRDRPSAKISQLQADSGNEMVIDVEDGTHFALHLLRTRQEFGILHNEKS